MHLFCAYRPTAGCEYRSVNARDSLRNTQLGLEPVSQGPGAAEYEQDDNPISD
jgi:hypothetical protein